MDENEPVEESEFIYRRIHVTYYDAALSVSVQPEAFRPTRSDLTGISVFRARFATPVDALTNVDPAKVQNYFVARLLVGDLHRLNLTVRSDPIASGPAGHAVIPELRWQAYQSDKQRLKQIQFELAKLASADIVHRPGT
jgi:hypothetical protein